MNEVEALFHRVVGNLERTGIAYMVVGSLASSTYGFHRSTHDCDIAISPQADQLAALIEQMGEDVYSDLQMAQDAMARQSMFNIIDFSKGAKAGLIALKGRPFDQMQFSRRRRELIAGIEAWVATPEDTILAKLEWSRTGDSERQYRDAMNVGAMQKSSLDVEYVRHWALELKVEVLDRLLDEIGLNAEPSHRDEPSD